MIVATCLIQCAQILKAVARPRLAWSFETTLILPAARFNRPAADRPPTVRNLFIVHAMSLPGKIVLFFQYHFARLAATNLEPTDLLQHCLLSTVSQSL